jgi:hypothetical protein
VKVAHPLTAASVDIQLLEEIYRVERVDTSDPSQGTSAYLGHLLNTALSKLFEGLGWVVDAFLGSSGTTRPLALALVAIAALAVVVALVRFLLARVRCRRGELPFSAEPTPAAAGAAQSDAPGWRLELGRRLAAGDLRAALEAAWWWLASSLVGPRADPAWTTRELLLAADRRDLGSSGRQLDAMLYGEREVDGGALEAWLTEAEAKLPR